MDGALEIAFTVNSEVIDGDNAGNVFLLRVMVMGGFLKSLVIGLLMAMWVTLSAAEEITKEQIKALDEQVQDIKKDVLDISSNLIQLEEKSIYPPNTQISIFLAVAQGDKFLLDAGDKFRLDAVKIKIDGKEAANHVYTFKELDALQHGGVQRIYTGNVRGGEHALEVALIGKSTSNNDFQQNANYKFSKDVNTKFIEITLAGSGISFKD